MSNTQIDEKAKEFIDALHALDKGGIDDADKIAALFSSEAALTNAALDKKGRETKGTDEILQFWVEYKETLGQIDTKFHHVMISGQAVGLFWTSTGTNPEGEEVNYHGSTLLQFNSEGKIEFFRGYYDTRELALKSRA